MRLLSREGDRLVLTPNKTPTEPYAILSHTWGVAEVSYEDLIAGETSPKIQFALNQAERDGYFQVWIDTCCINDRVNRETEKAINSMWPWYKESAVCYVYLADVPGVAIVHSRWFTRGWTLQELVAPVDVTFFDADGRYLGDRSSLSQQIMQACSVDVTVPFSRVPIAERWRWSLKRTTKEPEDSCYCLFGLLEVRTPIEYGIGKELAQERLLEAVEKEHGKRTLKEMQARVSSNPCDSIDALLDALKFDGMGVRHQAIKEPYAGTCLWIRECPEYKQWRSQPVGILWLKGHPGSGKSTLVKSVEDGIAFYFNARGTATEQSVSGMYRSLIRQLLQRATIIHLDVLRHVRHQVDSGLQWLSLLSLQKTFRYALGLAPVPCYIDALDECDQREVQEMIASFEGFKVLFASRYYPNLIINAVEVHMRDDVALYVRGTLLRKDSADEVIQKARGIFFWAVLVVQMLNEDYGKGIVQSIDGLPGTLDGLLEKIMLEPEDLDDFKVVMCLLTFSEGPLQSLEFCEAVTFRNQVQVHSELKFVSSCSRGLAEIVYGRVQVIHESVRQYMLKTLDKLCGGGAEVWGHGVLKHLCSEYLFQEMDLEEDVQTLEQHLPFLDYAHSAVFYHAEHAALPEQFLASAEGSRVADVLSRLHSDVTLVTFLIESNAGKLIRSAHAMGKQIDHANKSSLASALIWFCDDAFNALVDCGADVNGFWGGAKRPVLHIATWLAPLEVVEKLIRNGADVDAVCRKGRTAIFEAICRSNSDAVRLLVRHGAKLDAYHGGTTVLHEAYTPEMVMLVLELGVPIDILDTTRQTPLHKACSDNQLTYDSDDTNGLSIYEYARLGSIFVTPPWRYHAHSEMGVVQYLCDAGADLAAQDDQGRTPLHAACNQDDSKTIQTLCYTCDFAALGDDFTAQNDHGRTPLCIACDLGESKIIQILCDTGADVGAQDKYGRTPLHIACDADVGAQDENGRTPLHIARDADLAAQDDLGRTPLHIACDADDFLQDMCAWTLPQELDEHERKRISRSRKRRLHARLRSIEYLYKAGSNPAAQDKKGATPAQLVCKWLRIHALEALRCMGYDPPDEQYGMLTAELL